MRIAHFSDVHVGCWPQGISTYFDKRILGSFNFLLRRRAYVRLERLSRAADCLRELAPDWVVFTGDLTSVGTPAEFERGVALLARIREEFADRFIYVPGNHDAYVPAPGCVASLEACFTELNGGRWRLADLPAELHRDGVSLVVVNECRPTSCFLSTGKLTPSDWQTVQVHLSAARERGDRRILLGHFPLRRRDGTVYGRRRRLLGAEPVYEALRRGEIDVALCGHDHTPFIRREAGGALEVCAGAITMHGRIGVLDYSVRTHEFKHFWVEVPDVL